MSSEREKLYTTRWYVRERWGDSDAQHAVLDLLDSILDPASDPQERPSVQDAAKSLWCPFAETSFPRARTRGNYRNGYPRGAIVHFTAGRRSGLAQGLSFQVSQGYCYFLIDAEGRVGQNFPLDAWGYHAGRSSWPGLSGNVSDELVGIEIQAAGLLEKRGEEHRTWFGATVPTDEVRTVGRDANQVPGAYQKFTEAQEDSLTALLLWLHRNNPVFEIDLVLGHDEVSPGRKNDPGGALSMTMPAYRAHLKSALS